MPRLRYSGKVPGRVVGAILVLCWATSEAGAQRRSGQWYGGLELGVALPDSLATHATDNDVPTNCDQHLGEAFQVDRAAEPGVDDTVTATRLPLPLEHPACGRGQDEWETRYGPQTRPLLGLSAGHLRGPLRIEIEYLYRQHGGDSVAGQNTAGDKLVEFLRAGERISDIGAHHLFLNAYYDIRRDSSRWISYVGAGAGVTRAQLHYSAGWHRNPDRDVIASHDRNPNAAGTLTAEEATLSDSLSGFQMMAGIDCPLADNLLLGFKARFVDVLDEFSDGDTWDSLRSHESTVAPGGGEVRYVTRTEDVGFWGLSLNVKYLF